MTRARILSLDDARRIAFELSNGRRFFRNGDGWKTFCPLCDSNSGRRKPRPTLSLTVRDGKLLVYCHRCNSDRVAILRELVRRNLLPDTFHESSKALAAVNEVCAATEATSWRGIARTTDLAVLQVLLGIARQCRKTDFNAAVRQIAERALVNAATVSRSLRRLIGAGWLRQIAPSRGAQATA